MNKTLKLIALASGLALAVWIGDSQPVHATYSCSEMNGTVCYPEEGGPECINEDNTLGSCSCIAPIRPFRPFTWSCS